MSLYDAAKDALSLVDKAANSELYQKIVDLQQQAADLSNQLFEQRQLIEEKENKIGQLGEALVIKGKLTFKNSAYWTIDEAENIVDGPFCTKCWEVDHTLSRLINGIILGKSGSHWTHVQCPNCETAFRSEKLGVYINGH